MGAAVVALLKPSLSARLASAIRRGLMSRRSLRPRASNLIESWGSSKPRQRSRARVRPARGRAMTLPSVFDITFSLCSFVDGACGDGRLDDVTRVIYRFDPRWFSVPDALSPARSTASPGLFCCDFASPMCPRKKSSQSTSENVLREKSPDSAITTKTAFSCNLMALKAFGVQALETGLRRKLQWGYKNLLVAAQPSSRPPTGKKCCSGLPLSGTRTFRLPRLHKETSF
jgi:hypothetical protein